MNPELRERLARAIAAQKRKLNANDPTVDKVWTSYLGQVSAILTEREAAGWPATPEVPTEEMVEVVRRRWLADVDTIEQLRNNLIEDYTAMLRARPKI